MLDESFCFWWQVTSLNQFSGRWLRCDWLLIIWRNTLFFLLRVGFPFLYLRGWSWACKPANWVIPAVSTRIRSFLVLGLLNFWLWGLTNFHFFFALHFYPAINTRFVGSPIFVKSELRLVSDFFLRTLNKNSFTPCLIKYATSLLNTRLLLVVASDLTMLLTCLEFTFISHWSLTQGPWSRTFNRIQITYRLPPKYFHKNYLCRFRSNPMKKIDLIRMRSYSCLLHPCIPFPHRRLSLWCLEIIINISTLLTCFTTFQFFLLAKLFKIGSKITKCIVSVAFLLISERLHVSHILFNLFTSIEYLKLIDKAYWELLAGKYKLLVEFFMLT